MVRDIYVHFVFLTPGFLLQLLTRTLLLFGDLACPAPNLFIFFFNPGLMDCPFLPPPSEFISRLNITYSQVVHWEQNLFSVPSCSAGFRFVKELSTLFKAYGQRTSLETVALKAAMVLPLLLLQRPHHRSSNHNNKQCLERRLQLWNDGDLLQLLQEGRTIQRRLQPSKACSSTDTASIFARLMFQGKVKAALRLTQGKISFPLVLKWETVLF